MGAKATTAESGGAKHSGITPETIRAKTGRTWDEWFAVLDAAAAVSLSHKELAAFLQREHGTSEWDAQSIAVAYERARGLREPNQKCTGERSVSVSRTFAADITEVFARCGSAEALASWLGQADAVVRKANPNKNVRLGWPDGSAVELRLTSKNGGKCQVVADHGKLASAEDVERCRAFWTAALERLRQAVEP